MSGFSDMGYNDPRQCRVPHLGALWARCFCFYQPWVGYRRPVGGTSRSTECAHHISSLIGPTNSAAPHQRQPRAGIHHQPRQRPQRGQQRGRQKRSLPPKPRRQQRSERSRSRPAKLPAHIHRAGNHARVFSRIIRGHAPEAALRNIQRPRPARQHPLATTAFSARDPTSSRIAVHASAIAGKMHRPARALTLRASQSLSTPPPSDPSVIAINGIIEYTALVFKFIPRTCAR